MKKCISVAAILFIPILLHAQWKQNEGLSGGSIINDIISYKNNIFIAIADNGLYSSSDNGDSWSKVNIDHNWSIDRFGIHQDTLIAATSGFIFKTADGINWDKLEAPGTFIKAIYSEGNKLYIASQVGGISKSTNNGKSWIDINDEYTAEGVADFVISNSKLYASKNDNSGILFISPDDGFTWSQVTIEEGKWILDLYSNSKGVYLNIKDKILFSNNNGSTWSNITTSFNPWIDQAFIKDDILYVYSGGTIYTSIDNGGNWNSTQYKTYGLTASSIYVNESNIFVGFWGGGVGRNSIGIDEAWSVKNNGLFLNSIRDIEIMGDTVFVGTESSFVRTSYNQGETWAKELDQFELITGSASHLSIFRNALYVGTGGGGVRKRNQEQKEWLTVSSDLPSQIIDGLCSNNQYIFAASSDNGIYRSENPENGWEKRSDGISSGIRGLYSFDPYIFVGTWNGLFVSNNNGETWSDISSGLPDKSISGMVMIDTTIIAATQNGGVFRTHNLGAEWELISTEHFFYLTSKNQTLFKCANPGNLALSYDLGDTWELIKGDLPDITYITSLGFSSDYIFAGFGRPGQGIWQRNIHELIPAAISDDNEENEDQVIRENDPITITYDMQLMDDGGIPIDSASLQPYIKVYNSIQEEVEFSASIDTTSRIIEVSIEAPTDGETYTVQLDSMANKSNLKTAFTSQPYTFAKNNPPVLNPILKNTFENNEILISKNEILSSFNDIEEDPFTILHITSIPKHGILTMNATVLEEDTFIDESDLSDILYSPNQDFIGNDTIKWNAFDGYDYSEEISTIVLSVEAITGLNTKVLNSFTVYPNPTNGLVNINLENDQIGILEYSISDVSGKIIHKSSFFKNSKKYNHTLSMEGFEQGIYIIRYSNQAFRVNKL